MQEQVVSLRDHKTQAYPTKITSGIETDFFYVIENMTKVNDDQLHIYIIVVNRHQLVGNLCDALLFEFVVCLCVFQSSPVKRRSSCNMVEKKII